VADLVEQLTADESTHDWIGYLRDLPTPDPVSLPDRDQLAPILLDLAVPHEDIDGLVAGLPTPERDPELWWLLERATSSLTRTMGEIDGPPAFPVLPERLGLGPFFYVYVFVAALPAVRAFHASRGVPAEVSRRTFADLGRNLAVFRWRNGTGGLGVPFWLMNHFRGKLYDLGRMQFERVKLGGRTGTSVSEAGLPYGQGDVGLSVHIPEFSGPLSPAACDASFAAARAFFPRHFPDEPLGVAACYSWLLDPQLAEYLRPESNIVRFQRRFTYSHDLGDADADTLEFVFGQRAPDLDLLPQETTLQRAIVAHLRAGRHWHGGASWTDLHGTVGSAG
jgi:hypothetical protein